MVSSEVIRRASARPHGRLWWRVALLLVALVGSLARLAADGGFATAPDLRLSSRGDALPASPARSLE